MTKIEILLQGEGIADIELVELDEGAGPAEILAIALERRQGGETGDYLVFVEDQEEPLAPGHQLHRHPHGEPHRVHVHRCRNVAVTVTFNGRPETRDFAPSRTVAAVKAWAAKAFHMDPRDAAEHVLQLAGTADRPEPDTHLGSLVRHGHCEVRFDLVPLKRVEG